MSLLEYSGGQNVFGNACGNPATNKNYFLVLAGFPQRGKSAFWALRDSRNEEKVLFGLCGNPATRKNCFLALAGFPQRGKTVFWRLRESRNEGKVLFGACGSPASISKNVLTVADFRRHTADFILMSNSRHFRGLQSGDGALFFLCGRLTGRSRGMRRGRGRRGRR